MKNIKLLIFASLLCTVHLNSWATNYYVSALGNSNNTGLSQSFTWNLQKVNDYCTNFKAGDSILFKRGDTFRGTLKIQNSNAVKSSRIVFAAYGTGNKPIIKGSDLITNWKSSGNNLWVADYNKNAQHLFRNNKILTVSRFPNNDGLNFTTSKGTKSHLTDVLLNKATGYFNGATVHIHSINWQWEKRIVASSEANGKINFKTDCQYAAEQGWGYYFDNKYEFLDAENEWFCDTLANKIFLMSSTDPNLSLIETPAVKYTVELSWTNDNIVIDNLDIRHGQNINLYIVNSSNCVFSNNTICQGLNVGILNYYGTDNILKGNIVEDILSSGVVWGAKKSNITYNKVRRIALIPGYGTTGYGDNGMSLSNDSYVAYNRIDSIANLGLGINEGSTAEYNIINCACLVMNDCGGLTVPFGNEGGKNIKLNYNIVSNIRGGTYGTPADNDPIGNGIYYGGNNDSNVTTFRNIVYNCNGIGISMLDTWYSTARENVLYNNATGISNIMLGKEFTSPQNNNIINGNIIYGLSASQALLGFQNNVNENMPNNLNKSDNNYLYNPYSDIVFKTQSYISGGYPVINYTLNRLKTERQHDLNSKVHFQKLNGFKSVVSAGSNLVANGSFNTDINNWGSNQNYYSIFKWDNKQTLLNGGSLMFANNINQYTQPLCNFKIANNNSAQWYRVKFSSISNKPHYLDVDISNNNSPWNGITTVKKIAVEVTRTENEYLFQLPQGSVDARIGFKIPNETANIYTTWLDNVVLEPVTIVEDVAAEVRSPLFVNATNADVSYSLNGKFYKDIDGKDICVNSIVLKPFTAKILVLQDKSDCPLETENQQTNELVTINLLLASPNPTTKNQIVRFNKNISFSIYNILGEYIDSYSVVNEFNTSNLNPEMYIIKTSNHEFLKLLIQ